MQKVIFLVIALIILLVGGVFFIKNEQVSDTPLVNVKSQTQNLVKPNVSASPIPFEDLTIQFLRDKKYSSALGELNQVSTNANYISFLTSYTSDGLKVNGLLTIIGSSDPALGNTGLFANSKLSLALVNGPK